jgi:hypothetical protein
MCKKSGEFIVHLLLHCKVALEVWNMVCQLFGVMWVMLGSVMDCLGSWRAQKGIRTVLQTWRMMPLCVMWCLWRERNARNFEDRELGLMELKKRADSSTLLMESYVAFPASFNICRISRVLHVFF